MYWKHPHIIKVYEAITAIADERIKFNPQNPNNAKCFSSSGNKFYEISWDDEKNAIMSNDNSAYYTDTVSYPMIAYLMLVGKIQMPEDNLLKALKGLYWKQINQKYKNDYEQIKKVIDKKYLNDDLIDGIKIIFQQVINLKLQSLGEKKIPPKAY